MRVDLTFIYTLCNVLLCIFLPFNSSNHIKSWHWLHNHVISFNNFHRKLITLSGTCVYMMQMGYSFFDKYIQYLFYTHLPWQNNEFHVDINAFIQFNRFDHIQHWVEITRSDIWIFPWRKLVHRCLMPVMCLEKI